jgi:hypothetical protein
MRILLLIFLCLTFTVAHQIPVLYGSDPHTHVIRSSIKEEFVEKHLTLESEHFRSHYTPGLERQAKEILAILEKLYPVYHQKYGIELPHKTEVLVSNDATSGGWALALQNTIAIWVNDMDWNMRGTPNWLENVIAHEYAHIVSISASYKMPAWMPYVQAGSFSHSNKSGRVSAMHIFPSEVLPPWFFEGIAQYESLLQGGDRWDSHRDMILRTLTRSDSLLSWDDMSVFNGRFDNFEKAYNHGFLLVKYIAETYGEESIRMILRESARFGRLVFDNSIKAVLGITGRDLYAEWTGHLQNSYGEKLTDLGDTTQAKCLTKDGFNNFNPRFSHDEMRILFTSNGKSDSFRRTLHSYNRNDTLEEEKRIRLEMPLVRGAYTLHPTEDRLLYSSLKFPKKVSYQFKYENPVWDLFTYPLTADSAKVKFKKKELNRITTLENWTSGAFSPTGEKLAAARLINDHAYLAIGDSSGENFHLVYPAPEDSLRMRAIYSVDWSGDDRYIALSYLDRDYRKVGLYSLIDSTFHVISDTTCDSRDPRFSRDGKNLYFSSDQTGIFNIYKLELATGDLSRITNVSSGAFTPDISKDENELVYSAYTGDGYKVFLLDSLQEYGKTVNIKSRLQHGGTLSQYTPFTIGGAPRKYSSIPRKFLVIPTLISEEVLSDPHDATMGIRHTKYGAIAAIMDPLYWLDKGNSLTLFYLSESIPKQLSFLFLKDKSPNKKIATDYGAMFDTRLFPFDASLFYFGRNIPASNDFVHNNLGYDTLETLDYSLQPKAVQLKLSYPVNGINICYFSSYFLYKLQIAMGTSYFNYIASTNMRNGILLHLDHMQSSARQPISPRGFAAKLQWEVNNATFVDQEEVLLIEDGKIKENSHPYLFNIFKGSVRYAKPTFVNANVDVEYSLDASYLHVSQKTESMIDSLYNQALQKEKYDRNLPSLFVPAMQLPGYSYYYHADSTAHYLTDEDGVPTDTVYTTEDSVVVSGNAIVAGNISYRFPLLKKPISRKVGFIYFDRLFGAINGGGALTGDSFTGLPRKSLSDALFYYGAELRLRTITFSNFPLSLALRWDRGISKKVPEEARGHRFSLNLGFSFDNWGIISEPDGVQGRFTPSYLKKR